MTINELLDEKEAYKIPDKLLKIILDDKKRLEFLSKLKQETSSEKVDVFRDFFQSEQGDRKNLKQDYTPDCLCELIAQLIPDSETYADICTGTGALTLAAAHNNRGQALFRCEETAERAIPFLLTNLALNNLNADVCREDALTCNVEAVYKVRAAQDFSTVEEQAQNSAAGNIKYANIIMNPPYSIKFKGAAHAQFDGYPIPTNAADLLFVLHGLNLLADEGTLIAILPCGILFRGNKEREIRIKLIEQNLLDAVISLPPNMFMNTSIPVCLFILKRNREQRDILFIDASKNFIKQGKQNIMTNAHILAIADEYKNRSGIPRFSSLADLEEIIKNDYNLNIPRYVDTYIPEPVPNLQELLTDLIGTNLQIRETENDLLAMMKQLTGTTEAEDVKIKKETRLFDKYLQDKDKFTGLSQKGICYEEGSLF